MSQMKRSKLAVTEAAERLRAGESLEAVAADAEITRHTLMDRLSKAGFSFTGERVSVEQRHELRTYLSSALLRWYEPWMSEAACSRVDPDLWFPDQGGSVKDVKEICRSCPVVAECRAMALRNGERYGIWGATSEAERRKLLKGDAA